MATEAQAQPRRLERLPERRMLAGVCAGIAEWLRIDPTLVRIVVAVGTVATSGVGAIAYLVAWWVMPVPGQESPGPMIDLPHSTGQRAARRKRPGAIRLGAGVTLWLLAILLAFREEGIWWSDAVVWPAVLVAGGAALVWRQVTASEPGPSPAPTLSPTATPSPPTAQPHGPTPPEGAPAPDQARATREGFALGEGARFGIALILGGALLFLYVNGALTAAGDLLLAVVVLTGAAALILAPFWIRLAGNLATERHERIRSQERAEMAAHLHDSVLQTLAMIQRRAGDSAEIATLARRQERELRDWLSGRTSAELEASLSAALSATAGEIEEAHAVPVEVVVVGDRELDRKGKALVAAARESMLNAVRFAAGATDGGEITVYAEIEPDRAVVFVRDRGPGFELDRIPANRRGVRESILGRMQRHGGKAEIHTGPGAGCEVELTMEFK